MPHGLAKLGSSLGKALGGRRDRRPRVLIARGRADRDASARVETCAGALRALDVEVLIARGTELDNRTLRGCDALVIAGGEPELHGVLAEARSRRVPIVFLGSNTPFETEALNAARMQRLRKIRPDEFARVEAPVRDSQACLAAVDFVIAPSPYLVERAVEAGKNAFLVRDIPDMRSSRTAARGNDVRRLHYFPRAPVPEHDLRLAAPAIARLLTERSNIGLHVAGALDLAEIPELRAWAHRVSVTGDDLASSEIADGDIVIDAAAEDAWSASRSARLFAEAGALGVPFVASPVASYRESVVDGDTGFLCASPEQWHVALDRLLSDSALYEQVARSAEDVVREGFNDAIQLDEFGQCFETILGRIALRRGRFIPLVKRGQMARGAKSDIAPGTGMPLRGPVREEEQLPSIDVSIVLEGIADLRGFAESLAEQAYPPGRLGLLISCLTDLPEPEISRALNHVRDRFAKLVLPRSSVSGASAGHNVNLRNGGGDLILVADHRVRLEPGALARAAADSVRDDGNVAAWQFREKPIEDARFYDPVTLETTGCSARCQLFRRSAIAVIGGFSDDLSIEDAIADGALRLRKAGHLLRYNPAAVVWTKDQDKDPPSPSNWSRLADRARHLLAHNASTPDAEHEVQRGGSYTAGKLKHPDRLASMVVRVHGRNRPMLAEALTTLARQTYPNLEVVVVEHGGDLCAPLCDTFRAEGLQVRHIVNSDGGRARSGNVGLGAAVGSYLGFLDYDDLLMPDHVETLVLALDDAPHSFVATGRAWGIHTHYRFGATDFHYREAFYREFRPDLFAVGARELGIENVIPIQSVLFRRELYERLGGMDESLGGYEDWELWLRYAAAGDFVVVPKMTSLFRIRGMGPHNRAKVERQKQAAEEIRKRYAFARGEHAPRGVKLAASGLAL